MSVSTTPVGGVIRITVEVFQRKPNVSSKLVPSFDSANADGNKFRSGCRQRRQHIASKLRRQLLAQLGVKVTKRTNV